MSIIKFVNRKTTGTHAIQDGINYILNPKKTSDSLINGNGVSLQTPAQDIETIQFLLGKNFGRKYLHLILSFDVGVSPEVAYTVTDECTEFFSEQFQYIFAIHKNTENVHAHIIISAVNIQTGKKFSQSRSEMLKFRDHFNEILEAHRLNPVGKHINTEITVYPDTNSDDFFADDEWENFEDYDDSTQSFFGSVDPEEFEQIQEAELHDFQAREIIRFFKGESSMLPSGVSYADAESYFESWLDYQNYIDNEEQKNGFF